MRFKLVESFDKLNGGILATDSPFTIKNLIINKPSTYRILYDESIDTYFIGDGEFLTHFDLLYEAYDNGYYYQIEEYIDELGGIQFYYRAGENKYLYFLVFDNTNSWDVGDDGFDAIYKYDCGNMLSRACTFSDTELYKILNSHLSESLNECELNEASIDPEGKYTDYGTGKVTSDNIFDSKTHVSYYDQLFTNPDYMAKEENLKGHIEMMSPREYYEECATKIFRNTSVEDLKRSRATDPRVLDEIREIIVKYKRQVFLPYLNYAEQNQEGLHRMLVAAELFGWDHKFPVLIVEWADEELALQRKKVKEEDRIRRYIRDAVDSSLHYTYDKLEEFEEECKAQVDYKFDFIDETVNSFSVTHNNDETTDVEVNGIVYQFDTDKINISPRVADVNLDEIDLDDIELDDIDLDDLDMDEFLKKYGIG